MDRICIKCPDDPRDFMMALAVIQDYGVRLATGAAKDMREPIYEVTYRMNDRFQFLEPCMQIVSNNIPIFDYTGWDGRIRGDFDCFFEFDVTSAKNLVHEFPDSHGTEAFGILLGGGPLGILTGVDIPRWPILEKLYRDEKYPVKPKVAVIQWDEIESEKFYNLLQYNLQDKSDLLSLIVNEGDNLEKKLELISNYDIVIGPGSFLTYSAAAMEKAVIEIYPTREEALWYNSQGLKVYECIMGKCPKAEFVWAKAWEAVWEKYRELSSIMNKEEQITTTELPVYTAESVDAR